MIFLYLLFSFPSSFAQVGATTDALGGAGVANLNAVDSAFLNPAGLAFFSDVQFSGTYRFGKTSLGDVRQMNAVIADARNDNLFSGSLAYRQRDYERSLPTEINEKQFVLNTAFLLGPRWGMGLRGYKIQTDLASGETIDQYNGDLGVHFALTPAVALAATQSGLFSAKEGLAAPLGVLPETKIGGLLRINSFITVLADVGFAYNQNPNDRTSQAVGLSLTKMEFMNLNFGARFDERARETIYTAGLQFAGPRLKLGYAYQKEVRQEFGEAHTIDISMNL